jgi:hypothetical protein
MAGEGGKRSDGKSDEGTPPEAVAGGSQWHPLTTAAMIGGALAAGAGAYIGTRALARRNGAKNGKVNSVMATAMTACDLAQKKKGQEPTAADIAVADPTKR